ncbi:MAG: hypothetical protein A2901_00920 [Elusimicrobia bacterium RIFCSPLOWO2_01_FULL_54_10]|nr:MAG: hypothetical protein A2901_00920 [Elusimicrobia bacterium RIFCSPLOWO2_01_FULL_54_10]
MPNTNFNCGTRFIYKGATFVVQEQIPPFQIMAKDIGTRKSKVLNVREIYASPEFRLETAPLVISNPAANLDLSDVPEKYLAVANRRYEIVTRVAKSSKKEKLEAAAKEGCGIMSLYRWIKAYIKDGLRGLIPDHYKKRACQKSRFEDATENIMRTVFENEWASLKKLSKIEIYRIIDHRCRMEGLNRIPSRRTVNNRILKRSQSKDILKRQGKKAHAGQYEPTPGTFANKMSHSLECIQIDHKRMDVIVVDSAGNPIGRPWLTLGIDVFSRSIWGIHLGFNAPSSMSVAMCLYNGIQFKNDINEKFRLKTPWRMYGLPERIVVDNGKEFHSIHFESACAQLGIKLDYRKPYTPRHGGVVERFFETLDQRLVSTLEGKTFSHPKERGEYLSEKESCLTLEDLEKMIYIFIAELYQEGFHSGVGCMPNRKWEDGVQVAQPALPSNRDDLMLFLMKEEKRIVNRAGIVFNGIRYWHDDLIPLIRKAVGFRYDPRNISFIYVINPENNQFLGIPARPEYNHLSGLSVWEIQKIGKLLYQERMRPTSANSLMARERLELIRREAMRKTKSARKEQKIIESHSQAFQTASIGQCQGGIVKTAEPCAEPKSSEVLEDYEISIEK